MAGRGGDVARPVRDGVPRPRRRGCLTDYPAPVSSGRISTGCPLPGTVPRLLRTGSTDYGAGLGPGGCFKGTRVARWLMGDDWSSHAFPVMPYRGGPPPPEMRIAGCSMRSLP